MVVLDGKETREKDNHYKEVGNAFDIAQTVGEVGMCPIRLHRE